MDLVSSMLGLQLFPKILLVVVAAVVLNQIFKLFRDRNVNKIPRSFPSLPILGDLPFLGNAPHVALSKLAHKYGDIMQVRFGLRSVLVISSPAMAHEVLKTHDQIFASRPQTAGGDITFYKRKDMACAPYGQHWRLLRKLCMLELFTIKRIQAFKKIRDEEVSSLVRGIFEESQNIKSVDMQKRLSDMTMNTITRMVLGKKWFGVETTTEEGQEFGSLIAELFHVTGSLNLGDYIPFLKPFDLQGYEARMKNVAARMDCFLSVMIQDHRKEGRKNPNAQKDLVDVLLSLADEDGVEYRLDDSSIKGLILDILAGGTDTSATSIEWALTHLLRHPNAMKKVQKELDDVIGCDRLVDEADIPRLPYLQAVVKETLRINPPAPFLPHESIKACQIAGYHIPAKTLAMVNVWAIHHNTSVWQKPHEFIPERFDNSNIDVKGQDFELLPFGSGRRGCPGLPLGLIMAQRGLAQLLQIFTFELPEDQHPKDLDMNEVFGLATRKVVPLLVVVKARLPHHLYT